MVMTIRLSEDNFDDYLDEILIEPSAKALNAKIDNNIYEGLFERDITTDFFEFLHSEKFNVNSGLIIYIVGKKGGGKTHKALSISHHLMSERNFLAIYQGNPELTKSIQKTKIYREDQVYHTSTTSQIKPHSTVNIDEGQLSLNAKNAQKKDSKEIEEALATLRHNNSHIIVNSQRWKGSLAALREQADIFIFCRLNYLTIKAIDDDEIRDILIRPENRIKAKGLKFSAVVISNYEKWQNSGIVNFKLEDCPFWNNEISKNYENMSILQALNYQKEVEIFESKLADEFIRAFPDFAGKNLSDLLHYYILCNWKNINSICHDRLTDFSDSRFIRDVRALIIGRRYVANNEYVETEAIVENQNANIENKEKKSDIPKKRPFDHLVIEFADFCKSHETSPMKAEIIYNMIMGTTLDNIVKETHQTKRYVSDLLFYFRTGHKTRNGRHLDMSCSWLYYDLLEEFIALKVNGVARGSTNKNTPDVSTDYLNIQCKAIYTTTSSERFILSEECAPEMNEIRKKVGLLVVFNPLWTHKFYVYKLSEAIFAITTRKGESTDSNLLFQYFEGDHGDQFHEVDSDDEKLELTEHQIS